MTKKIVVRTQPRQSAWDMAWDDMERSNSECSAILDRMDVGSAFQDGDNGLSLENLNKMLFRR